MEVEVVIVIYSDDVISDEMFVGIVCIGLMWNIEDSCSVWGGCGFCVLFFWVYWFGFYDVCCVDVYFDWIVLLKDLVEEVVVVVDWCCVVYDEVGWGVVFWKIWVCWIEVVLGDVVFWVFEEVECVVDYLWLIVFFGYDCVEEVGVVWIVLVW